MKRIYTVRLILSVTTILVLLVIALGGSAVKSLSASTPAPDVCSDCTRQCLYESLRVRYQCINQGIDLAICWQKEKQYRDSCESIFCNYGGLCTGGTPTPVEPVNDGITVAGFDAFEACLASAHQVRQQCGDSQTCTEQYEESLNACDETIIYPSR